MLAVIFALTGLRLAAVPNAPSLNSVAHIIIIVNLGTAVFILLTKME